MWLSHEEVYVSEAKENTISGKIADTVYLGELAQYVLRTGQEPSTIHISELNPTHLQEPADHTISASVKADDVVILHR